MQMIENEEKIKATQNYSDKKKRKNSFENELCLNRGLVQFKRASAWYNV